MTKHIIQLFVMHHCQVCPQMERLFQNMHNNGAIDGLKIVDVGDKPEIAQQYNIRSVPHYLINDVAFYGLKTEQEILRLLQQDKPEKLKEYILTELSEGQLEPVERLIRESSVARDVMMLLLETSETSLVARIGLSAVIESIAETNLLNSYENRLIKLTSHQDERIAIDAIYYLSLLATEGCLKALAFIAESGKAVLQSHAAEVLEDLSSEA